MRRWALLLVPLLWWAPSCGERCDTSNVSCFVPLEVDGVEYVGHRADGIPLEGATVTGEQPSCEAAMGCEDPPEPQRVELYTFPGVDPAVALVEAAHGDPVAQTVWLRYEDGEETSVPDALAPYLDEGESPYVSPTPPRAAAPGTAPASPAR